MLHCEGCTIDMEPLLELGEYLAHSWRLWARDRSSSKGRYQESHFTGEAWRNKSFWMMSSLYNEEQSANDGEVVGCETEWNFIDDRG